MRRTIVLRPEAQADVASIRTWYRTRGAEARFDRDMDETLAFLSRFPKNFKVQHKNYRAASMVRFKYFIIYRISHTSIIVYRVRHKYQQILSTYFGR
jgi:plasmid stabilization system protein ParE